MVKDTVTASYLGQITSKKIKKRQGASERMIEHYLANRAGWSKEPKPEKSNNKGLILKMLEDMNDENE